TVYGLASGGDNGPTSRVLPRRTSARGIHIAAAGSRRPPCVAIEQLLVRRRGHGTPARPVQLVPIPPPLPIGANLRRALLIATTHTQRPTRHRAKQCVRRVDPRAADPPRHLDRPQEPLRVWRRRSVSWIGVVAARETPVMSM